MYIRHVQIKRFNRIADLGRKKTVFIIEAVASADATRANHVTFGDYSKLLAALVGQTDSGRDNPVARSVVERVNPILVTGLIVNDSHFMFRHSRP